jgi:hypothetical protein
MEHPARFSVAAAAAKGSQHAAWRMRLCMTMPQDLRVEVVVTRCGTHEKEINSNKKKPAVVRLKSKRYMHA